MLAWLKKPYPFLYESLSVRLKVAAFIFVFVFLFLVVFKPFDIDTTLKTSIYTGALLYGAVSAFMVLLVGTLVTRIFPNYFCDKGWTIGKEMISTNLMLISAAIGNAVLSHNIECRTPAPGVSGFWLEIYRDFMHTYTVGIFPVMVLIAISYSIFLKRNLARAIENNRRIDSKQESPAKEKTDPNPLVTIVSPANNNDISFRLNDLLFVMADGNYVEFHMEADDQVKREIKRNTLSHIESQLAAYDHLFRSHRAYLVNLKKVVGSSGNAQGYELELAKTDHRVPVSRKNLNRFDELIKS